MDNILLFFFFTVYLFRYVGVPTRVCLLKYGLFTFITRIFTFVYYMYAVVLFIQYYIMVFATFWVYMYIQGVPGGMCETSGECSLC